MRKLGLVLKKIEIDDNFINTQKQKQLIMKVTLMMCLNQSILQLYQAYKSF